MSTAPAWSFSEEAVSFLANLKANNNKEWFAANKAAYERSLKTPAAQFCEIMCDELEGLTGEAHTSKVFRIYRDVRFSKDKTPYNAHLHISFLPSKAGDGAPAWMFALQPEKVIFGLGVLEFPKPVLEAYRDRVAGAEGEALTVVL